MVGDAERDRIAVLVEAAEARLVDDLAGGGILDVGEHPVPAALVGHADRGQVAEHVLADRIVDRVRLVVRLFAVDDAGAVGGLAVQVVEAEGLLLALLLVRTRRQLHVDGGAGDQVLVVARRHRQVVADLLADQHFRTLNRDAAAFIAVIENVGAIVRQNASESRRPQETRSEERLAESRQLHPQPPPTPPVAPRAPSRDSSTCSM